MNEILRIDDAVAAAVDALESTSDSARLDAELLLARALDVPRSYLFAHPEEEMDPAAAARFSTAVERRAGGMPMAYITGEREFWSLPLIVGPDTLVPRPETEILVEQALIHLPRRAEADVLDLGTGTGAIALAIAKERPGCHVVATDVSDDALAIARVNARELALPNIEFVAGDWFSPVQGRTFDMIVSNPPYIASGDAHLEELRFEPSLALEAGADGLDAIRRIAAGAPTVLRAGGTLLVEHGATQDQAVAELFEGAGLTDIRCVADYAGHPRVTVATAADSA